MKGLGMKDWEFQNRNLKKWKIKAMKNISGHNIYWRNICAKKKPSYFRWYLQHGIKGAYFSEDFNLLSTIEQVSTIEQ